MLSRPRSRLLLLLVLAVFSLSAGAINLTQRSATGLGEAYGFLIGQEYSLQRIGKTFPELAPQVAVARAQFGAAFPGVQDKLKAALGPKGVAAVESGLNQEIRTALSQQPLTRKLAHGFLEEVKARAGGQIPSPVLEYVLAAQYEAQPVQEILDGHVQRFETDGRGKSRGIRLRLKLPRSWAGMEGERPHIVRKWVSENGTGLETILVDVRDGEGMNPSNQEIDKVLASGELKGMVPTGAAYVGSGGFTIEGRRGWWIQYSTPMERARMTLYLDAVMYQFFFRGQVVGLSCQAGGPIEERAKVNVRFKRVLPLCQQVLNSLVLPQAY